MDRKFRVFAGSDIIDQGKHDVTWKEVRSERDQSLEETDWRALKDRTMSQAWKDYRTALRDLPQENDTANDAADNWPVMPDA